MRFLVLTLVMVLAGVPFGLQAQHIGVATTTLTLSVCGNLLVDDGEDCDVPGETGEYSQTIVGRQCKPTCDWGPYCGDGILQTGFLEECDDGNNEDADFCSSICKIEPAGSGGGGSSGGNSSGGGGRDEPLGDTIINITGKAYPSVTVNFLLDTEQIGTARSNARGDFEFATDASPGTATLGIWAKDRLGNRSITLNNTFDVTQGAVTNLNSVILPPTLTIENQNINPGDTIRFIGQAVPTSIIEVHFDKSDPIEEVTAADSGDWVLEFDSQNLTVAEHLAKARSVVGTPPLTVESSFSTALQLFIGVDGKATTPSDLSRDGAVNLTDFSILIYWWQTSGGSSEPPADINGNGTVGLEDFSILLYNWTG